MPKSFDAGLLRNALTRRNLRWKVLDTLRDDELAREHALGGDSKGLLPAATVKALDLARLLGVPSANPLLNERRVAHGFLAPRSLVRTIATPIRVSNTRAVLQPGRGGPVATPGSTPPPAGGTAAAVDWRMRWGTPWITTVQNQQFCGSCWAFATVALVESMVRIEHAVWAKASEADVHDGMGRVCADWGNLPDTIAWIQAHGVCDAEAYPYHTDDTGYHPPADRDGRSIRVPNFEWIGSPADQKVWLDTVGPIATWMMVWRDFDFYGGGIYEKVDTLPDGTANYERGGHFVLIVGYDDAQGCWICKNSWGTGWGEADWRGERGYIRVKYGEAGIDDYAKLGVRFTNPDPWTKRRLHGGNMIESGNGELHRNFEMVATAGLQLRHWWRDGRDFQWHVASMFGTPDAAACPALTSTTYNRNFELVYLTAGHRLHHWWLDQGTGRWNDGGVFGPADAAGVPGLCQGNYGQPGNFEVVVRTADGRLAHWWRQNGAPWTWSESARFAGDILLSGPTLVQSNYGRQGNLELVAVRTDGRMQHYWRDNDNGMVWRDGAVFGAGVTSPPCMIEGQFGCGDERAIGNFELCVAVGGVVQHWWRDNQGGTGWHMSASFGSGIQAVTGLVEGSFGFNLEVVALRTDRQLQHFWRDGGGWHAGSVIGSI